MARFFIAGVAALFLATGTAHAPRAGEDYFCPVKEGTWCKCSAFQKYSCSDVELDVCKVGAREIEIRISGGPRMFERMTLTWEKRKPWAPWLNGKRCKEGQPHNE